MPPFAGKDFRVCSCLVARIYSPRSIGLRTMLLFFLVPLAVLGVLSTALVVFLLGVPLVTLPHGKSGQPRKLHTGRYTAPPPPTV